MLGGFKTWLQTPTDEAIASQDAAPATGDFSTVGGFQNIDFNLTASEIDVTNQSSDENKEILNERGVRAGSISGSGILQDSAIAKAIEANVLSQKLRWLRIVQDDTASDRTYSGRWKITDYSFSAPHDGPVTFSFTLSSSGEVSVV